ncbi:MAG TPA: Hpt domain-containing protein [Desulfurivibrio alkaliphilus]|uniref:Hpt domain-containing protein n=1 Tax=Desulfurivibrio alkaliphilus TaxID=427923 RepID=A0A7C2XMQ4_9BACT|nr:Hpt domain-containing protein [Desulfurivibrio alkaliphilus]
MVEFRWDRAFALEQAGGDEELLAELLALLRDSVASDLELIRAAAAAGDGVALADAAHNTKGAAASLGMEDLRWVAHELERVGRDGNLAGVEERILLLERLLVSLQDLR